MGDGAGDESTAISFVDTALADAMREGALLWTLPWVTAHAAISASRGACSLSPSLRAQLAQIRCALISFILPILYDLKVILHVKNSSQHQQYYACAQNG